MEPREEVPETERDVSQLEESLVRPYKYLYGNEYVETLSRILTFTKKRKVRHNRGYITNIFKSHPARAARAARGAYGRNMFSPKIKKSQTRLATKFNVAPNSQFVQYINKKHSSNYAIAYSESLSLARTDYNLVRLIQNVLSFGGNFFGRFFFSAKSLGGKLRTEVRNPALAFKTPSLKFYAGAQKQFYTRNYFQTLTGTVRFYTTKLGQFGMLTRHVNQLRLPANLRIKKKEKARILLFPSPTTIGQQFNFSGLPPVHSLDYFRYSTNLTLFRKYWAQATSKNNQPTSGFTKEMAQGGLVEIAYSKTHPTIYGFFFYTRYLHVFKKSALPGSWSDSHYPRGVKKQLRSSTAYALVRTNRCVWNNALSLVKKDRYGPLAKPDGGAELFRSKKYLNRRIWRMVKKKQNKLTRLNFNLRGFFALFENRSRRMSLYMAYFISQLRGTGFKHTTAIGPGGDILKFKRLYVNLISNWDKPTYKKISRDRFRPHLGRYLVDVHLTTWL